MALVVCRECGNQVSDQATTCPSCGVKSPAIALEDLESPANVSMAVALLWATLGLAVVGTLVGSSLSAAIFSNGPALFVMVFTFAALAGLNIAISRRQNWARYLYLITLIVGLLFLNPLSVGTVAVLSSVGGLVYIAQTLLQIGAAILLFSGDSNRWFTG